MPTTIDSETANGFDQVVSTPMGVTVVATDGYSGTIDVSSNSTDPQGGTTLDPALGNMYYVGTLDVQTEGSETVVVRVNTGDTNLSLGDSPAGYGPSVILYEGANDSLSMDGSSIGINGITGTSLDLSKTTVAYYNSQNGQYYNSPAVVIGTTTGNDYFKGGSYINYLYEGSGNNTFFQSAGTDVIQTTGGTSTYLASDSFSQYEGGYVDSNGQTYMNNGANWFLKDIKTGGEIILTNVTTVNIDDVEYSSNTENQVAAWPSTSAAAATGSPSVVSLTPTSQGGSSQVATQLLGQDIHLSLAADMTLQALGNPAALSQNTSSYSSGYLDNTPSVGSLGNLMLTSHNSSVENVLTTDNSQTVLG